MSDKGRWYAEVRLRRDGPWEDEKELSLIGETATSLFFHEDRQLLEVKRSGHPDTFIPASKIAWLAQREWHR